MKNQICTILGGGGFIGRYLVRNLTKKNYRCIITTRKSFQKGYLKTQATPGSIELIDWNTNNFGELNYLIDETQEIAKKFGAVCTPDFFGYNKALELQYRGRFKELKDLKPINNKDSDLKLAMKMIAETQKGPDEQVPSVGCSIKWFN